MVEKGTRCVLCGTAPWEWEDNRFAYYAVDVHCQGCYVKAAQSESSEHRNGVTVELRPAGTAEAAAMTIKARDRERKKRRR